MGCQPSKVGMTAGEGEGKPQARRSAASKAADLAPTTATPSDPATGASAVKPVVGEGGAGKSTSEEEEEEEPVSAVVGQAMRTGGVAGVLALMKRSEGSAEFQWWCCDALASLCAGDEENRADLFIHHGIIAVLTAMKLYKWDPNVQTKAFWAIANVAATYADYLGKQGAVEAVVEGMLSCHDDYQVQTAGTRCLGNLVQASEGNLARARKAGAPRVIEAALACNPEDGQLQWRGKTVLKSMRSLRRMSLLDRVPPPARQSPWSVVKQAVLEGRSKDLAADNLPGTHGKSRKVARAARRGVQAVLELVQAHSDDEEMLAWCFDALATLCEHDDDNRGIMFMNKGIPLAVGVLKRYPWSPQLCTTALWALTAMAGTHAMEVGQEGAVEATNTVIINNSDNHSVLIAAVRLFQLAFTVDANCVRGRDLKLSATLATSMDHHIEDGMLKYKVDRVLERLGSEPLFSPNPLTARRSEAPRRVAPSTDAAPQAMTVPVRDASETDVLSAPSTTRLDGSDCGDEVREVATGRKRGEVVVQEMSAGATEETKSEPAFTITKPVAMDTMSKENMAGRDAVDGVKAMFAQSGVPVSPDQPKRVARPGCSSGPVAAVLSPSNRGASGRLPGTPEVL